MSRGPTRGTALSIVILGGLWEVSIADQSQESLTSKLDESNLMEERLFRPLGWPTCASLVAHVSTNLLRGLPS